MNNQSQLVRTRISHEGRLRQIAHLDKKLQAMKSGWGSVEYGRVMSERNSVMTTLNRNTTARWRRAEAAAGIARDAYAGFPPSQR